MTRTAARGDVGLLPLWFGLLAGPLAWGAHLAIGYLLVTLPCIVDVGSTRPLLYALTAVTALVALAATAVATWAWRRAGVQAGGDLGESGGRPGFMAVFGVLTSGISLLVIVVESFAIPVLHFCE